MFSPKSSLSTTILFLKKNLGLPKTKKTKKTKQKKKNRNQNFCHKYPRKLIDEK